MDHWTKVIVFSVVNEKSNLITCVLHKHGRIDDFGKRGGVQVIVRYENAAFSRPCAQRFFPSL